VQGNVASHHARPWRRGRLRSSRYLTAAFVLHAGG